MHPSGSAAAAAAPALADGWPRASRPERLLTAGLALGAILVLVLAALVTPAPGGLGTHERLGMRPCSFHTLTGRPCPGCGVTTAFSRMAHGRVVDALIAQPFGVVLFLLTVTAALGLAAMAVSGRSCLPLAYHPRVPALIHALVVLWLAGWGFKIVYGEVVGHY